MTFPFIPLSPQQEYIVELIAAYLEDKVDDPQTAALEIWRMTRTKLRPVVSPDD